MENLVNHFKSARPSMHWIIILPGVNLDDYKSETKLIFPKLSALHEFISKLMSREITPGNKNVKYFTDQAVKIKKNSKI